MLDPASDLTPIHHLSPDILISNHPVGAERALTYPSVTVGADFISPVPMKLNLGVADRNRRTSWLDPPRRGAPFTRATEACPVLSPLVAGVSRAL